MVGGESEEEGSENESLKGSREVEGGRWVESEVDREYGEDDV